MFASLESFSVFFFSCLVLIILGIVFEEKLINIEERVSEYAKSHKKAKMHRNNSR